MPFVAGTRLGQYDILAAIGAGGMGEVYRARDTRLGRDVAIKILPAAFTSDPDRLERFAREARILASLNHPNIATIHGVEEAVLPESGQLVVSALVLELVEGATLAERIASGPIPSAELLDIARQIADALEAAHEKGIVHRDLKPANIKLTPEARVKVLDFGLAKALFEDAPAADMTHSPTLTALGTRAGIVLGTAAYMSPEQARGLIVDKRTDVWAFGCVVYEMATRRPAFGGATTSDTIAAILEREPDWERLQSTPALMTLLRRCLAKDARRRLRDIGDARLALDDVDAPPTAASSTVRRPPWWTWIAAASVALVAGALATRVWFSEGQLPGVSLGPLRQLTWDAGFTTDPAISADGRLVAYASDSGRGGNMDVWVQQVTGGQPIRLTMDPTNDTDPDVSPDSSLVAFRSERQPAGIYVVPAFGGDARLVAPDGRQPKFSPDGRSIAFWTGGWLAARGIANVRRVFVASAAGGDVRDVPTGLASAGDPVWSPDGRLLLMFGRRSTSGPDLQTDWWVSPVAGAAARTGVFERLEAYGIDTGANVTDLQLYPTVWSNSGVLFTAQLRGANAASVWRIPLDARTGKVTGDPVPVTTATVFGHVTPSVSHDGRLLFASISRRTGIFAVPIDANRGTASGPLFPLRVGGAPTGRAGLSADGRTLVFSSTAFDRSELWIRDVQSGHERQLAVTPPESLNPVISADGKWIGYTVTREATGGGGGAGHGYVIAATGGSPQKICEECQVWSWLDNGARLFVTSVPPSGGGRRAEVLNVRTGERSVVVSSDREIDRPVASPVGGWFSYNEGNQAIIAPLHPDRAIAPDERRIIVDGQRLIGRTAGWSPDGRLLYVLLEIDGFRCLYSIPIDPATGRAAGAPMDVHHFHDAHLRWGSTGYGNAVVDGLFYSNHAEHSGNIWMTTVQKSRP